VSEPCLEPQNLTRSCHEVLILAALADGARHGYQLGLDIEAASNGNFRFKHGTLYPILHSLEKQGLIEGRWDVDAPRRKRKSYVLTRQGRHKLASDVAAWRAFTDCFFAVVEQEER
jgi:DNA-binding PadR family transcriptional regulator